MGCASSTSAELEQENALSKSVEKEMVKMREKDSKPFKLLLLGAGASGKSTLLKQMIKIYGKGFSEDDLRYFTPIIFQNILHAMKLLLSNCDRFGTLNNSLDGTRQSIMSLKADWMDAKSEQFSNESFADQIKTLWADPLIKTSFDNGAQFHLPESCKYFFDKIDEVCKFGYVPTDDDILRVRAPTNGVVETEFLIDGNIFKMFDVGGQRSQRRKWIHCFDNVTAVLFVAAVSEYNQMLYEDERTNRLVESITLFGEVCNARWFKKTSLILFLNKRDILSEKITLYPFVDFFPDYHGENEFEPVCDYIKQQFINMNDYPDQKKIYTHITCATDTENIRVVFNAVKEIVITTNLKNYGLMR